jgi:hypothetical protein
MPKARDSILLGRHGEIPAGDEIPETFVNSAGETEDTDFERLEQLGLIADEPDANDEPEPEPEPEADPYDGLLKADLEQLVDERGLEVTGTGADGAVKVDDLLAALRADDAARADGDDASSPAGE